MKQPYQFAPIRTALSMAVILAIGACGGGSSSTNNTPVTPTTTTLTGVAANGAALLGTAVKVTDATGVSKDCTVTAATGAFSCDTTGMTGPFLLTATGIANEAQVTLVSASTTADGTVNIMPLTTAIVATAIGGTDPTISSADVLDALKNSPTALTNAKTAYQTLLADVMKATGNEGADLLTGTLVVGDSAMDKLLDFVKADVKPTGEVVLTTVAGQSDDTPKILTLAQGASASTVAAADKTLVPTTATIDGNPVTPTGFSAADLKALQQAFTGCFNSTASQRMNDATLPEKCKTIAVDNVADADRLSGVPAAFLSNGQNFNAAYGQTYGVDDGMNNAQFALPEIVRVQGTDANGKVNKAWVHFTWLRSDGLIDGVDAIVQIAKTASDTDNGWRLVGNQRPVLSKVDYVATRRMFLNPSKAASYDSATDNADAYVSEIQTVVGTKDKDGVAVDFAVVTGPGLPTAGLFLRPSSGTCDFMTITAQLVTSDISGDDATVAFGKYGQRSNCSTKFRVTGIAVDPTKQIAWPTSNRNWLSSGPLPDISTLGAFTKYTFRIYQNGNRTAPTKTLTTMSRAPMLSPLAMRQYTWHDASTDTLKTLDPTDITAFTVGTKFPVTWTAKANVPAVTSINVQISNTSGLTVNGDLKVKPVAEGMTSTKQVSADGGVTWPSVATIPANGYSFLQLWWKNASGNTFASAYEYDK
jgi:hypothetical protein